MEDAVLIVGVGGRVMAATQAAERLHGASPGGLVGAHYADLYVGEHREGAFPSWTLILAAVTGRHEEVVRRRRCDGGRFVARIVTSVLRDGEGGLIGFSQRLHAAP